MNNSDDLLCLFTAQVSKQDGSYVIEVPTHEIELGAVQRDGVYRVGLLPEATETTKGESATQTTYERSAATQPEPPVKEGEVREVEIEDVGDQGDGLARIDGGYVVIVPNTDIGDSVTVRITEARENVAFADVIESRHKQAH